jgi:hypothetical protein
MIASIVNEHALLPSLLLFFNLQLTKNNPRISGAFFVLEKVKLRLLFLSAWIPAFAGMTALCSIVIPAKAGI